MRKPALRHIFLCVIGNLRNHDCHENANIDEKPNAMRYDIDLMGSRKTKYTCYLPKIPILSIYLTQGRAEKKHRIDYKKYAQCFLFKGK